MMTIPAGAGALDYFPCRYGASKATFRGPARDLTRPYIAMLGGSATFGKYVERPFADLVEQALGRPVANLGALNAGPDFYFSDSATFEVAARADVAVVQITGADTLSNPFYSVHSRRNDRFLAASPALRTLFPNVDFAEIHFTRHLLQVLFRSDPAAHAGVVQGLKSAWLARMKRLFAGFGGQRVLLWLADAPPPEQAAVPDPAPALIDRTMIEVLRQEVDEVVVAVPTRRARALSPFDMIYPETEEVLAACLPGSTFHREVADRLVPILRAMT